MGGLGPLVSSHWSSRSWIPSTERIHKPRDMIAHKVKHEALSQFDIEACVSERTYYRSVQIHYFEDESTTDRFNPTISRDELTKISVQSHEPEDKLIDGLVWSY
jgi:hypothetical protein